MYVVLDNDPPENGRTADSALAVAVAQERIRGLKEQVATIQEQLELERRRNVGLVNKLRTSR